MDEQLEIQEAASTDDKVAEHQIPAIEVDSLWRKFDDLMAVRNVSFQVTSGQVVGFIGANGAGKTTTMRILATLDQPTSGQVKVCGHDVVHQRKRARDAIGWMPDAYGNYKDMVVWEYLDFFARSYGFSGAERIRRLEEVMDFTGLDVLADRKTDTLSKGMSQRLCLGRMLVPDPDVMILDEPAAGLDPKARIEFKHLVRLLAEEGKTLLISSHILTELEDMCDTLLFIHEGSLVHHGAAEDLKTKEGTASIIEVRFVSEFERIEEWVQCQPGLELLERTKQGFRISVEEHSAERLQALLKKMVMEDMPVKEFFQVTRRLEDAFVDLLQRQSDRNGGGK
jgi:ABC-2 type transport system ATP-binding protein